MRIDAHQHFWRYDARAYPWIDDAMAVLRRDFLAEHLRRELDAASLDGCIAVQARQSLEETRWLLQLARESPSIRAVVGWVDLCSQQVEEQLDLFAGDERLRGIRHIVQDERDDAFMLRPDFQRGVGRLDALGLVYEILIYPRHLEAARQLASAFPGQRFVLDHMAKPFVRDGLLEPWRTELGALAERPNVCCKVSGLVTEADWDRWRPADCEPYLDTALDAFGEDRLLFGSDWPVCLLAAPYERVAALVADWAGTRLSPTGREKLFGGNAARVYGLRP